MTYLNPFSNLNSRKIVLLSMLGITMLLLLGLAGTWTYPLIMASKWSGLIVNTAIMLFATTLTASVTFGMIYFKDIKNAINDFFTPSSTLLEKDKQKFEENIDKLITWNCDLIAMPPFPEKYSINYEKLPGKSITAYMLTSDDKIYYVDKGNKIIQHLNNKNITKENLELINKQFAIKQAHFNGTAILEKLKTEQIEIITNITMHTHPSQKKVTLHGKDCQELIFSFLEKKNTFAKAKVLNKSISNFIDESSLNELNSVKLQKDIGEIITEENLEQFIQKQKMQINAILQNASTSSSYKNQMGEEKIIRDSMEKFIPNEINNLRNLPNGKSPTHALQYHLALMEYNTAIILNRIEHSKETLSTLTELILHRTLITCLPSEVINDPILAYYWKQLKKLDLSNNQINTITGKLPLLAELDSLYINYNQIKEIPADIMVKFPKLTSMAADHNCLTELPDGFPPPNTVNFCTIKYNAYGYENRNPISSNQMMVFQDYPPKIDMKLTLNADNKRKLKS
jgi:hypothetical protein